MSTEGWAEELLASDPIVSSSNSSPRVPFRYTPLDYIGDPDAVRLLTVSPELLEGYIQVDIRQGPPGTTDTEWPRTIKRHAKVVEPTVEYRCLSYTWGAPCIGREILLNGCIFRVRNNLYEFLNVARRLYPSKSLWIDALCIDQTSLVERGHQVQRMDRIYKGAFEVLIWLGLSPALNHLATYINPDRESWKLPTRARKHFQEVMSHSYWTRAWDPKLTIRSEFSRNVFYDRIKSISQPDADQSYVIRITQEILLARTIRILHASGTISWDKFGKVVDAHLNQPPDGVQGAHMLWLLRNTIFTRHNPRYLIVKQYETACADNRDRIYSLLGLLEGGKTFLVDYEEEAVNLFWRAGEHFDMWSSFLVRLLQKSLGLCLEDLRKSSKGLPNLRLTLPIHYAYHGKTQFPRRNGRTRCRLEKLNIPYERHIRYEALLCTCDVKEGSSLHQFPHVLLSRSSDSDPTIVYTLVVRSYNCFRSLYLENASLQVTLDSKSPRGDDEDDQKHQSVVITHWEQFWERVRNQSDGGRPLSGKWELKVPAKYVAMMLEDS